MVAAASCSPKRSVSISRSSSPRPSRIMVRIVSSARKARELRMRVSSASSASASAVRFAMRTTLSCSARCSASSGTRPGGGAGSVSGSCHATVESRANRPCRQARNRRKACDRARLGQPRCWVSRHRRRRCQWRAREGCIAGATTYRNQPALSHIWQEAAFVVSNDMKATSISS